MRNPKKSTGAVRLVRRGASGAPGPGLAAIRSSYANEVDRLDSTDIFDRIGCALDAALEHRDAGDFIGFGRGQIAVGVCDQAWRRSVLIARYDIEDLQELMAVSSDFLVECSVESGAQFSECLSVLSAKWSRDAQRAMRSGKTAWKIAPDLVVGGLLKHSVELRHRIRAIGNGTATPVLAVALNSTVSKTGLNCSIRAFAFPLPEWARPSGSVGGNA